MRLLIHCLLFLGCFAEFSAQNINDFSEMLVDAEQVLYVQPEQCGKIVEHIIQNSENTRDIIKARLLQGRSYYVRGEYDSTVKSTLEAKKLAETTKDIEMQLEINAFGIHILSLLDLDLAAEKYHDFTVAIVNELEGDTNDLRLQASRLLIEANKNREQEQFEAWQMNLQEATSIFQETQNSLLVTETEISLIEIYVKSLPIDSAKIKLEQIRRNLDFEKPNDFLKMIVLNQLGQVYFLKKEYKEAIETYMEGLALSEKLSNKVYKNQIVEGMAVTYMALDDSNNFYIYKKLGNELANETEADEANAVNTVFNYASANHTAKRDLVKYSYQKSMVILSGLLCLILLTWLALKVRYRSRAKQYEDFLQYFKKREKVKEEAAIPKKVVSKSASIPKETEELLLQKLDQFERSIHFTKKDMSLGLLASQFDTNTKYLSEIINSHKDKNFNSYINELRINYIIDKLKSNNTYLQYKISYLAQESGFTSHSSFATVFKSVTGIPPTVFIELLKSKKKSVKGSVKQYEHAE